MKTLSIAVALLFITSCGIIPHVTPGVSVATMTEAKHKCTNDTGVRLVNATYIGYTVVCNNETMYLL